MTPQTVTSDWRLASPVREPAYMLSPPPTFRNRSNPITSHVAARSMAPNWPPVWYSGMASSIRWFTALM